MQKLVEAAAVPHFVAALSAAPDCALFSMAVVDVVIIDGKVTHHGAGAYQTHDDVKTVVAQFPKLEGELLRPARGQVLFAVRMRARDGARPVAADFVTRIMKKKG